MTSRFARRALSITGAAALTLIAALAPQAAFADTPEGATSPDTSELHSLIVNDPDMQYVSVAEAEEQFGYDPAAEGAGVGEDTGPVVTPLYEWWGCEWDGKADNPHVTAGEASVHGYWLYISGDCPSTADVTVNLQALGCSTFGCSWITQATDTATAVTPGSGTGHWATPHKACANSNPVGWRGEVWVGLTDFWHPYGGTAGPELDLNCSPA